MPTLSFKWVASSNVKLGTHAVETRVRLGHVHHGSLLDGWSIETIR